MKEDAHRTAVGSQHSILFGRHRHQASYESGSQKQRHSCFYVELEGHTALDSDTRIVL